MLGEQGLSFASVIYYYNHAVIDQQSTVVIFFVVVCLHFVRFMCNLYLYNFPVVYFHLSAKYRKLIDKLWHNLKTIIVSRKLLCFFSVGLLLLQATSSICYGCCV